MKGLPSWFRTVSTRRTPFALPLFFLVLTAVSPFAGSEARAASIWESDVMYFMMTDRFFDGDPANNVPPGSDRALFDSSQRDIDLYHGGDFRGIELAILDGYFKDLGITSIWITPPVKNVWNSPFDSPGSKSGYHGYWTQDFLDIDPHLTSATDLEGRPYPPGRDGRLQHYKDLVRLANENGIRIVQDIVCNHIGPLFFYDFDGNGRHDLKRREWKPGFKPAGDYLEYATWADEDEWNMTGFGGPLGSDTPLGVQLKTIGILAELDAYWGKGFNGDSLGKSDGEEIVCDFLALRAINTDPASPHFDAIVDEFVEIYHFYIDEIGVDGLRIDTVKHVHKEFWDAFAKRLRARLGSNAADLLMFGEVFGNSIHDINYYAVSDDGRSRSLDGLLNFQFKYAARAALRRERDFEAEPLAHYIERMNQEIEGSSLYPADERRRMQVNFIGNHDGPNRFLVRGIDDEPHFLALAFLLTMEGIPCLYYGSELSLRDTRADHTVDSETGRFTAFDRRGNRSFRDRQRSETFKMVAELIQLRRSTPALVSGEANVISEATDDEVLAFTRGSGDDAVVVLMNLSKNRQKVDVSSLPGSGFRLVYSNGLVAPEAPRSDRITLPGLTVQIYTKSGF